MEISFHFYISLLINLYSSMLNKIFKINNIIEHVHIDLTPKFTVNIPPKDAPNKNEAITIIYLIDLAHAASSFLVIAKYAACEAVLKFPLHIVVLYGESTNLLKDEICTDETKDIVVVTNICGTVSGMNPIIKSTIASIIKINFSALADSE